MKEIHFYTNLLNIEQVSEWDLENMLTDYVSTLKEINDPDTEIIKTTQLSFLIDTWFYIEKGYKIYIHNGAEVFEIKEHINTYTGKDIRNGHNILKLFLNGEFGKIE